MLNPTYLIPDYTEVLVAPLGVFQFFYVFTFLLHIIFVNLTIGGIFTILLCKYIYKNNKDMDYNFIAHDLSFNNTYNISLTVSTAVAPLLFIQVLYDKLFYSSSVIIAFYWLSIILAIIVAYYLNYIYKFRLFYLKHKPTGGDMLMIVVFLLFLYTAFVLVSNTLISLNPDKWNDLYKNVYFANIPTLLPRYLHFIIGAVALNGIFICIYSQVKKSFSESIKTKLFTLGKYMFIYATLLQFIVGLWFLFSHEKIIWLKTINGFGMVLIIFTVLAASYMIYLFLKKGSLILITLLGFITFLLMIILRRLTEIYYLDSYLKIIEYSKHYQFSALFMFLILFIIMLILFAFLFKNIQKNKI